MGLHEQCADCGQAKVTCPVCQGLGRIGSGRFGCRKCKGHGVRCPDAGSPGTDCGRLVSGRGGSAGGSPAATLPGRRESASTQPGPFRQPAPESPPAPEPEPEPPDSLELTHIPEQPEPISPPEPASGPPPSEPAPAPELTQ